MPTLSSHADLQSVRNLPFCYLCGKSFHPEDETNTDHVPPKTIFAKSDRQNPLVLKTHKPCNESYSEWDQLTGDFVSVLHETARTRQKLPKHTQLVSAEDQMLAIQNVPLTRIVGRFIRAFHAALYQEFLPYETNSTIQLPFPSGRSTDAGIEFDGIRPQYPVLIEVLKKNRIADNVDHISCFSDRCHYFCVWCEFDDGRPCCLFALRIYEWERLADTAHFPRRACAGAYWNGPAPENATRETSIEIPYRNIDPLDPFAD